MRTNNNLMKITILAFILGFTAISAFAGSKEQDLQKVRPVPFQNVKISDRFWAPRMKTMSEVTLKACLDKCEYETGRVRNFERVAGTRDGEFEGIFYDDSDLYKVIEGVAYSLINNPNQALENRTDSIIAKIAAAQQPDGYIFTYYCLKEQDKKWTDMGRHEMYCGGHLIEAGVAYYMATGKRTLLDVGQRFANHIDSLFGPGKRDWVPGHEEIELALVKLYIVTGEKRYFDLAYWLLEERGKGHSDSAEYNQDNKPVRDINQIYGHAVRAMYLFAGMADVAAVNRDKGYMEALQRIWDNVVKENMYVTGGIGSSWKNEGFTGNYDLPNADAYCETCASIGMAFWNARMNRFSADAKYFDVFERSVYNGALAGYALSGDKFFYVNPLESPKGTHHRQPWFSTACCPTNLCRFVPSVGGYVYGTSPEGLYVSLYVQSEASVDLNGTPLTVIQSTEYPYDGKVSLTIGTPKKGKAFGLYLRIPEWCKKYTVQLNGTPLDDFDIVNGYARIDRKWNSGDKVELTLDMPVEMVYAHPRVKYDIGKVAVQRGPLVYCAEETDNKGFYEFISLAPDAVFTTEPSDEMGGTVKINAAVNGSRFTLVPYCLWDNREPGKMKVWIDNRTK